MDGFESIIAATKSEDIWEIERWFRSVELHGNIDTYKRELDLTPAAQLASQGQWKQVSWLLDNYQADTNNILFGAVIGGYFDEVHKCQSDRFSGNPSTLQNICIKHSENYRNHPEYKGKSPWIPVVKALAYLGDTSKVQGIFKHYDSVTQICLKGLLEAAVTGFAYSGHRDDVFYLLNILNTTPLSADQTVQLSSYIKSSESAALYAAARGGNKALVNELLEWKYEKFRERKTDISDDEINLEHKAQLIHAVDGAILGQQMTLAKSLLTRYLSMEVSSEPQFYRSMLRLVDIASKHNQMSFIVKLIDEFTKDAPDSVKDKISQYISKVQNEAEANGFGLRKQDINYLQRHYQLLFSHAFLLSEDFKIKTLVKDIAQNNEGGDTRKILETYLHHKQGIDSVIDWIKLHQPRSAFITSLEHYIETYNSSTFFGRNHVERAQSVLNAITAETSDESFAKLIKQQFELLNQRPADIVIGTADDKHNQPASRRMRGDGFTVAVYKCLEELQAKEQKLASKSTELNEVGLDRHHNYERAY